LRALSAMSPTVAPMLRCARVLLAALLLPASTAAPPAGTCTCTPIAGITYGSYCASWDAKDEAPWCAVASAAACGEDDTFEDDKGRHWAHLACDGMANTPPKPGDRDSKPGSGALVDEQLQQRAAAGVEGSSTVQLNVSEFAEEIEVTSVKLAGGAHSSGPAANCVDGDLDTFCHSASSSMPWVVLDLGAASDVRSVKLWNRHNNKLN